MAIGRKTARRIDSEAALDRAIARVDSLLDKKQSLSKSETRELDELGEAVREYEEMNLRVPSPSQANVLRFLMDAHNLAVPALSRVTGVPQATLDAVLTGRGQLHGKDAQKVASHFRLRATVFTSGPRSSRRNANESP